MLHHHSCMKLALNSGDIRGGGNVAEEARKPIIQLIFARQPV